MIQHSRIRALAVLVLLSLLGGLAMYASARAGTPADNQSIDELQVMIAQGNVEPATWVSYGDKLRNARNYSHAAAAYQEYLKFDPYSREVKLQCANCLALGSDANGLLGFMKGVVLSDPRLAVDIFGRPELRPYLAELRFQQVSEEAQVQSLD